MALITDKIKLNPKATGSAPSGTEGALYYNSDEEDILQHDGSNWGAQNAFWKGGKLTATGGNAITTHSVTDGPGYKVHTFTSSGTFTPDRAYDVDVLIVGGGGGAHLHHYNGGGGAGGLIYRESIPVSARAYTVTVGAGGATETNGGNSVFASLTALGGGRCAASTTNSDSDGGSGGGSSHSTSGQGAGLQSATTSGGYGYGGGDQVYGGPHYGTGGGGGAGAAGNNGTTGNGGNGGAGRAYTIRAGSSVYYAGGGGGGRYNDTGTGGGGSGGGGNNKV